MEQYHDHLRAILANGTRKAPAREGMPGSISLFGYQNRYNLQEGFPILTTKKINFKNIVTELLWFLKGDTNIKYLVDNGCNIWNEDAYNYYCKIYKQQHPEYVDTRMMNFETFEYHLKKGISCNHLEGYEFGDTGKQYGWLWRNWKKTINIQYEGDDFIDKNRGVKETLYSTRNIEIDQIKNLIEGLKSNPEGRRHIITAWNPATLDDMALNACHSFVQFNVREELHPRYVNNPMEQYDQEKVYYLDCQLYQRSADMFLGVPYNIASYALLTEIIAKIVGMIPGEFIHSFGDSHIYDNHLEQVEEILSRDCNLYPLPKLQFDKEFEKIINENWYDNNISRLIDEFKISDFQLENYQSYPAIKAKLSTGLK